MGSDTELNILIKARNEASAVLSQVKNDVKDMGGGIKSALNDAKAGSAVVGAAVIGAGVAAIGFGAASVKAYNESQAASAQLDAVLQSTGHAAGVTKQELLNQATALQTHTKFTDEDVQATQAMLLTFTNIHGPVMKRATGLTLDMAQALGMDGKQAALQLGKALNDPAAGMTKLQRIGVTFTDQQKQQVAAMQAAGDTAGAQGVILNELQKEFGGSADAAGKTFAGQLTILKNTFGDLQEEVGRVIVQALTPLMGVFTRLVGNMQAAGGIIPYVNNFFREHAGVIVVVSTAIMGALVPALVAAATGLWALFAPLIPFIAAGAAIGFIINYLVQQFGGWGTVLNALKPVWDALVASFQFALGIIGQVVNFFKQHQVAMAALAGTLTALILPTIIALTSAFIGWGIAAVSAAVSTIIAFLPLILIGAAIGAIAYLIISNWDVLKGWFAAFGAFMVGLWNGIVSVVSAVWNVIYMIIWGVLAVIFTLAGFIINGIMNYFRPLVPFIQAIWNGILAAIMFVWSVILAFVGMEIRGIMAIVSPIAGFIGSVFNSAVGIVRSIWGGISGFFASAMGGVRGVVGSIAGGISGPFRSAFNSIADLWNGTVGKLSFTVPNWVPGMGGKGWSVPKIPHMATGGIVDKATLAMIGEGNSPEAVVPLDRIGQFVNDIGGGQGQGDIHFHGPVDFNSESAVDRFFDRLDRKGYLASKGVPT